jgi:outer membrane biosynthesis protein TonB
MFVQIQKYSWTLTFLAVSLLLPICLVFFACAHQSPVYNVDQLDKAPRVIGRVPPVYPSSGRDLMIDANMIGAKVKIRCLVDKNGKPQEIVAAECDPEDALDVFGPPAVAAVKKWRFSPGEIGGDPVPTRVVFNVIFERIQPDEVTP